MSIIRKDVIGGQLPAVFASVMVALPYGRRNPFPVLTA